MWTRIRFVTKAREQGNLGIWYYLDLIADYHEKAIV